MNRIGKVIITSFLSTPSGWRATGLPETCDVRTLISIHALRVEGDKLAAFLNKMLEISIHALRVEGDRSTRDKRDSVCISIHALRVEGDKASV